MAYTQYSVYTINVQLKALTAGENVRMNENIATQMMNDLNAHWVSGGIAERDFITLRNILADYAPSYKLLPPAEIIRLCQ